MTSHLHACWQICPLVHFKKKRKTASLCSSCILRCIFHFLFVCMLAFDMRGNHPVQKVTHQVMLNINYQAPQLYFTGQRGFFYTRQKRNMLITAKILIKVCIWGRVLYSQRAAVLCICGTVTVFMWNRLCYPAAWGIQLLGKRWLNTVWRVFVLNCQVGFVHIYIFFFFMLYLPLKTKQGPVCEVWVTQAKRGYPDTTPSLSLFLPVGLKLLWKPFHAAAGERHLLNCIWTTHARQKVGFSEKPLNYITHSPNKVSFSFSLCTLEAFLVAGHLLIPSSLSLSRSHLSAFSLSLLGANYIKC